VGPWNTPWETFAAWIVIGGSVVIALVWAVAVRAGHGGGEVKR
jgi:hypothetical protein